MRSSLLLVLLAFLLFPLAAVCQQEDSTQSSRGLVPWTNGFSAGASIWPISKERLRAGFHWEARPNRHFIHELALIQAADLSMQVEDLQREVYGDLSGWQFSNELRFYHNKRSSGPAYWYHGVSLAYMYSRHSLSKGMECDEWGSCAYFRYYEKAVAHTSTLSGNFGVVLSTAGFMKFNFYTGLGFRGTYFPVVRSDGYFGKSSQIIDGEQFVLQPYIKLGANAMISFGRRKERLKDLQNP